MSEAGKTLLICPQICHICGYKYSRVGNRPHCIFFFTEVIQGFDHREAAQPRITASVLSHPSYSSASISLL